MKTVQDKVAAITGAGSGIGRAVSALLAARGCNVALCDVNEEGLAATAETCRASNVKVTTAVVDVADRRAVHAWADQVRSEHGEVNIVVNNAGVALAATIEDMKYEDLEWLMGIDFWGVVHGTKAFLPHLKAAGEGHIVNVSSIFGVVAMPTQGAYNAAKFAVRGFTEALRQELEIEGSPIGVTCVHPGGIKTNIARNARQTLHPGLIYEGSAKEFEKAFRTTPEAAAKEILDAILHDRPRLLIGSDAKLLDFVQRAVPGLFQRLAVSNMRKAIARHRAGEAAAAK